MRALVIIPTYNERENFPKLLPRILGQGEAFHVAAQLVSRGGSLYAKLILGVPVNDLTSGFKCFSSYVLRRLDLDSIRSNGYAFQVEVSYRCHRLGFRIAEVPIVFVDRRVGRSKMSSRIVFEAMLVVANLRVNELAGRLRGILSRRRRVRTGRVG